MSLKIEKIEDRIARIFVVLAVLAVAVTLFVLSDSFTAAAWSAPLPQAPAIEHPINVNITLQPPMTRFNIVWQHPLFSPGRKADPDPDAKPAAPALPPVGDLSTYRMLGIAISGDSRLAMVVHSGSPSATTLHVGDTFDGWTVSEIDEGAIQFSASGNRHGAIAFPKAGANSWSEQAQQ